MPVPQKPGTATSVVSADTDVVRLGIEGQSVRARTGLVKPKPCDTRSTGLDLDVRAHYAAGFMPSAPASVRPSIFPFVKFAAFTRS